MGDSEDDTRRLHAGSYLALVLFGALAGGMAWAQHSAAPMIVAATDTPARLRAHSKHFNAGSAWQYYTGTSAASAQVQKSLASIAATR